MARSSGRRTDYTWATMGDVVLAIDIGAVATVSPNVLQFLTAQTVTRIRGKVAATLDTGGAGESCILLAALGIFPTDMATAPEIFTTGADEDSWIWQGALYLSSGAEAAVVEDALSFQIDVDTKAMRRVKPLQELRMIFEVPSALATDQGGTVDATSYCHVLTGQ